MKQVQTASSYLKFQTVLYSTRAVLSKPSSYQLHFKYLTTKNVAVLDFSISCTLQLRNHLLPTNTIQLQLLFSFIKKLSVWLCVFLSVVVNSIFCVVFFPEKSCQSMSNIVQIIKILRSVIWGLNQPAS